MRMNAFGRAALNNPLRVAVQEHYIVPKMIQLGGDLSGCRVLEIGCGRGRGLTVIRHRMGAAEVMGVDLDPKMLRAGAALGPVAIADITHLPVRDAAVDAVVDFGALHLVPAWRDAVREVRRVLRPGGRYLFEQVVGRRFRASMVLATGQHLTKDFHRDSLLAELESAGLTVQGSFQPRWPPVTGMVGDLIAVARKH